MNACGGLCWWCYLCSFVGLQFVTYKVYVFVTTFGQFVLRRVFPRAARNEIEIHEEPENEAEPENDDMIVRDESTQYDEVPEIDSLPRHGDLGEEELAVDERISDAGSSSVNDDPEVNEAEWIRWNQIKESVENEVHQRRWKRILREVVGDDENTQIDSALRGVIIQENWTDTRCRTYKKLLDIEDTVNCTSDQIRLWNRLYNDRLLFMIETDMLVKKQREEIESLDKIKKLQKRFLDYEVQDKQIQTPLTLDPERNKFVLLPEKQHGAWLFCSPYYPHRD